MFFAVMWSQFSTLLKSALQAEVCGTGFYTVEAQH